MTDWRNRIIEVSAMRPIATSARLAAVPFANAKVALGTVTPGFNRATMGTLFRMGNDTSIEMPNDDIFQFLGTEDLDELLASIEGNDG